MTVTRKTLALTLLTGIGAISLCGKVRAMEPQKSHITEEGFEIIGDEEIHPRKNSAIEDEYEVVDLKKKRQKPQSRASSPTKLFDDKQSKPKPQEKSKITTEEDVEVIEDEIKTEIKKEEHQEARSKEAEDARTKLRILPVLGNMNQLCPALKMLDLQHVDSKQASNTKQNSNASFLEKCTTCLKKTAETVVAVVNQYANSSAAGKEYGGDFNKNFSAALCQSDLFASWSFIKTDLLKQWGAGEKSHTPLATDFILLNNKSGEVAVVPQSIHLTFSENEKDQQKHALESAEILMDLLERLVTLLPSKRILVPIDIFINEVGIAHQLMLELDLSDPKEKEITVWDSLTNLSNEAIVKQMDLLLEIINSSYNSQEKKNKFTTKGKIKLKDVQGQYKNAGYQMPLTGNCTRFALFFVWQRSLGKNLKDLSINEANEFCTFIYELTEKVQKNIIKDPSKK